MNAIEELRAEMLERVNELLASLKEAELTVAEACRSAANTLRNSPDMAEVVAVMLDKLASELEKKGS